MKLGLVLEGGASRSVYSCGVLDVLMESDIKADIITGASAGISYGISYASGQVGRNKEIAKRFMGDKRYMGARHLFNKNNKSYYNIDFVFTQMPKQYLPYDYKALAEYPGKAYAAVTNMLTGKAEYMQITPEPEKMKDILVASCALPLLFQPVYINGVPYMDGGIADSIPYEFALKEGCDKLIIILTRQRDYTKKQSNTIGILRHIYRKYPEFFKTIKDRTRMYNEELNRIQKLEKEGKAFVFRPDNIDGFRRTENDPEKLMALFEQGYNQAKELLPQLKAFLG